MYKFANYILCFHVVWECLWWFNADARLALGGPLVLLAIEVFGLSRFVGFRILLVFLVALDSPNPLPFAFSSLMDFKLFTLVILALPLFCKRIEKECLAAFSAPMTSTNKVNPGTSSTQ